MFILLNIGFLICVANLPRSSQNSVYETGQQATAPIKIDNKTTTLEIADIKTGGNRASLTLKNNTGKIILSFIYSFSPRENSVAVHNAILPGKTLEEEVIIPDTGSNAEQGKQITILGVLFSDGSADGDLVMVQELRDSDTGNKIQIGRINGILQDLSVKSESDLEILLEEAKSKIRKLEDPPEAEKSSALRSAINTQNQIVLITLRDLEQIYHSRGFDAFQKELGKTKENFKSLSKVTSQ
jgi:hypothetical protein